jgi:hypothetical protein
MKKSNSNLQQEINNFENVIDRTIKNDYRLEQPDCNTKLNVA